MKKKIIITSERSNHIQKFIFVLSLFALLSACQTISIYDHYAYVEDTSLKVDALGLIDKGVDSFNVHEQEVNELKLKVEKAFEYEKSRPNNSISTAMWNKLKDPGGNLLGGFFKLWKNEGKLSETYILDKKKQIGSAFDQIIELESKKINE